MACILVADDDAAVVDLIERALVSAGHRVLRANDGAAALAALDQANIDFLITGLHMPYLDGIRLVRLAREAPEKPRSILLVSGTWSSDEQARAHEAGVDRLLLKESLRPERVVKEVNALLRSAAKPSRS